MTYLLIFILIILIVIIIILRINPLFIKFCHCNSHIKKEVIRDVQKILWFENQQNYDLMINVMMGIKVYFNAIDISYAVFNSKDEMTLISLDSHITKELENLCSDSIARKSLINHYELNNHYYISYVLRVENYNIGTLLIESEDKHKLSENDFRILQSFSEFVCLKQRSEILDEALCKSEADLETIMNNATDGVIFCDRNGIIHRVNKNVIVFSNTMNPEDMMNKHVDNIFKSINNNITCSINNLINDSIIKKKPTEICRALFRISNNKDIQVDIKAVPIFNLIDSQKAEGAIVFFLDAEADRRAKEEKEKHSREKAKHYLELQSEVLQRKEVEKALIRSAALASAGTLAAGIAHEYNNINNIAMGNLDVLVKMKTLPPFVVESINTVRNMTARGAEITRSLLDYAKGDANGDSKREVVSLIDLAEETKNLVAKEFSKEGIEFSSNFDKIEGARGPYLVLVNSSQIKQTILNLVLNARHALSDRKEKIVSFEVGLDDECVFLAISDTGHGISKEDIKKLFQPFFTTKGKYAKEESQKKFKGSGLGLAVNDMIMKRHGGSIKVDSKEGSGTKFTLKFLKITNNDHETKTKLSREELIVDDDIDIHNGQNKKILILDDEIELCKLLSNTLIGNGYKAKYTDNGYEALKWNKKDQFDLVITDIQMSKMSGAEFLNNLSIDKGPKRIVMTGRVNKKDLEGVYMDEFIYKPFDLFKLMGKIQEILKV